MLESYFLRKVFLQTILARVFLSRRSSVASLFFFFFFYRFFFLLFSSPISFSRILDSIGFPGRSFHYSYSLFSYFRVYLLLVRFQFFSYLNIHQPCHCAAPSHRLLHGYSLFTLYLPVYGVCLLNYV